MKPLVLYYSRTGSNKTMAEAIAKAIVADCHEIVDCRNRGGALGFLRSGYDAYRRKLTEIELKVHPEAYDPIIIGNPVWAGRMTPAVRTFLTNHSMTGKQLAFFSVSGDGTAEGAFDEMKRLAAGAVVHETLVIAEKDLRAGNHAMQIQDFVRRLEDSVARGPTSTHPPESD